MTPTERVIEEARNEILHKLLGKWTPEKERLIDRIITAAVQKACEPLTKALEQCRVAAHIANPEYRIERTDEIVRAALAQGEPPCPPK